MIRDSYSEVVRGARKFARPPIQVSPDDAAVPASLAWEPSPASPSPPRLPSPAPPPPPRSSAFPALAHGVTIDSGLPQAHEPLTRMRQSWTAATTSNHEAPPEPAHISCNSGNTNAGSSGEMVSPLRAREMGPSGTPLKLPESGSGIRLPPSSAPAESQSETWGPNSALWDRPEGADLIIRCRSRGGREVHWEVHRDILMEMSEWMEKYMPPEAEDGSTVVWDLSNWDAGQLGAVLQYMYLEDFKGGVYDPDNPLNIESLVLNTVHFLAGTACLCRPMMDQAIDQIDDTTDLIQEKVAILRLANIDELEISIRRALLIMYDEPDQWRIRALRIVMGKLMAVCFPLILQSQRWETYQRWWGMLRVRVVADHKWLYQAGMCPRNDVILSGFENLDVIWVRYRKEGWQPSDDLMFPTRKVEDFPDPPFSAPPTPAGGKKKSKAIPIVDPSGNIASVPGMSATGSAGKVNKNPAGKASSPALVQSVPNVEDPFTTRLNTPVAPLFLKEIDPFGASGRRTKVSQQPHSALSSPFLMRPPPKMATSLPVSPQRSQHVSPCRKHQPIPVLPWLPDGPFYFAETSTGTPASKSSSNTAYSAPPSAYGESSTMDFGTPSVTEGSTCSTASATPSIIGESSSNSAAASSIDPLDSPTCRMADLNMAFDVSDGELADELDTPRAPAGNLGFAPEEEDGYSKNKVTPRASMFDQTKAREIAARLASTPTAVPAN